MFDNERFDEDERTFHDDDERMTIDFAQPITDYNRPHRPTTETEKTETTTTTTTMTTPKDFGDNDGEGEGEDEVSRLLADVVERVGGAARA